MNQIMQNEPNFRSSKITLTSTPTTPYETAHPLATEKTKPILPAVCSAGLPLFSRFTTTDAQRPMPTAGRTTNRRLPDRFKTTFSKFFKSFTTFSNLLTRNLPHLPSISPNLLPHFSTFKHFSKKVIPVFPRKTREQFFLPF
jgi:hypothetical protein